MTEGEGGDDPRSGSEALPEMGQVVIRPALPDMSVLRVIPNPTEAVRQSYLRLDPAAGELFWRADRAGATEQRLPLGADRGGVVHLVVVSYPTLNSVTEGARLLLTDEGDRVLASSRSWPRPLFEQVWSEQVLQPVRAAGVDVVVREFRSPRRVQRAYPGGARYWYLTSEPWLFLIIVGGGVTLVVLIVVALTLLGVLR